MSVEEPESHWLVNKHPMKMTYDSARNIAYLSFQEKHGQVTTLQISDDSCIDIGEDGTLYGIELLNANEQLSRDHGQLIFESPAGRHEIALSAEAFERIADTLDDLELAEMAQHRLRDGDFVETELGEL